MAHKVKCYYCGLVFDRDKTKECCQVNSRRWAHSACHEKAQAEKSKDQNDLQALEDYIIKLLDLDYIDARVRKQINDFHDVHHYSYSGIHKALTYFYEVKKNSTEKANGGIGIVPYVYKDAYNYYYHIWMAQQSNEVKPIEQYVPQERVITIPPPKRVDRRKKYFSFLEEEEPISGI